MRKPTLTNFYNKFDACIALIFNARFINMRNKYWKFV